MPGGGLFYHCRMRLIPGVLLGSAVLAGFGLVQAVAAQPAAPASPTTAAASLAAGSPEWIVDRFFVQKEFPELERYATGEFAELYEAELVRERTIEEQQPRCGRRNGSPGRVEPLKLAGERIVETERGG